MFFLHDLKLKKKVLYLKELPDDDSAQVIQTYGQSLKKKPNVTQVNQPYHLIEAYHRDDYPWGPDPSWSRIHQLLETEPENFIREWRLDDSWEHPKQLYTQLLFTKFTHQLWLSLAESFASSGVLPKPTTFEDAMETWTVSEIQSTIGSSYCQFVASSHGLKGKLPPSHSRDLSFSARRQIFFPSPDLEILVNSIWEPYAQPQGYISDYHNCLNNWDKDDVNQLHHDLDDIFSQLQCLPVGGLSVKKGKQAIWAVKSGKIQFISNPKFYRIREIGKEVATRPRTQVSKRPHASKLILRRRLDESLGRYGNLPVRRRKSTKMGQKRKPPVRSKGRVQFLDRGEQEREWEQEQEQEQEEGDASSEKETEPEPRITRSKAKAARNLKNLKGSLATNVNPGRRDLETEGLGREGDLDSDSDSGSTSSLEYTDRSVLEISSEEGESDSEAHSW